MAKEGLRSQTKQHKIRVTRGRVRRPITVEVVPAKTYPADSRVRLRAAAMPFIAHAIHRLIDEGLLIEVDSKIISANKEERKP